MRIRSKTNIGTKELGLSEKEMNRYSIVKAVGSLYDPIGVDAAFERDLSKQICKRDNRATHGIIIPQEILEQRYASYTPRSGHILTDQAVRGLPAPNNMREAKVKRGMMASVDSRGGYLVDEELRNLLEILVENTLALQNVPVLNVEGSPVNIPGMASRPNVQSTTETGPVTESALTFSNIAFNQKFLKVQLHFSRTSVLLSSTDIEMLARNDIALSISKGMDTALLFGTGDANNQPLGVKNTTGIHEVPWNDSDVYDTVLECMKRVGEANIPMNNIKWLASWFFPVQMKTHKKLPGNNRKPIMGPDGKVEGIDVEVTSQIQGTNSQRAEGFYGNWSESVITLWQDLEIEPDPYTLLHQGIIRLVATVIMDFKVLRPKAFARLGA